MSAPTREQVEQARKALSALRYAYPSLSPELKEEAYQQVKAILDSLAPKPCGAGHICCNETDGPPFHDHFLVAADCPACGYPEAQP